MCHENLLVRSPPFPYGGHEMEQRMRLEEKSRKTYVEGLQKYQDRGIPIYINGQTAGEADWEQIFEVREDGSFYMGDYILEEEGDGRKLKEIRFDKVYYR